MDTLRETVERSGAMLGMAIEAGGSGLALLRGRFGRGARRVVLAALADQIWYTGLGAVGLIVGLGVVIALGAVGFAWAPLASVGAQDLFGRVFRGLVLVEIAPLVVAMVLAARSGTAIATELGGMRVRNEVAALTAHGVDPIVYLVLPRLLGGVLAAASLDVVFSVSAYLGAGFALVLSGSPDLEVLGLLGGLAAPGPLVQGVAKSAFFGLLVMVVATYAGLRSSRDVASVPARVSEVVSGALLPVFLIDAVLILGWYA